jgi:hypothetical protein
MRSIRIVVLAALALVATAPPAAAQATGFPRVELFGGYSRLPADGQDFPRPDSNGVLVDLAGNLTRWFAVIGELAWYRGTDDDLGPGFAGLVAETSVRQYLIGTRFTARGERANSFAHALFGTSTGNAGEDFAGFSDSGITLGAGGGVDVHLDHRFSVRVQTDWIGSFADIVEDNLRFSVGGVVRF